VRVGDRYMVQRVNQSGRWYTGDVIEVTGTQIQHRKDYVPCKLVECGSRRTSKRPSTICVSWYELTRVNVNVRTEERGMNSVIAKLFDKTADAVLVEKHLGGVIKGDQVEYIKLNGKQKELLALATELEEKNKRDTQ